MKIREAKREDIKAISRLATKTYVDTFGFKFSPLELKKNIEETRSVKFYSSVFGKDTILVVEEDNQMFGKKTLAPKNYINPMALDKWVK